MVPGSSWAGAGAMMRREVFDEFGLFEESFRTMYEDQVFFSKVSLNVPIYVADMCWAKYRQHPQSCSVKSGKQSYYTARRPFLIWLEHYLKTQNIQDVEIIQLVKQELWRCLHPRIAHLISGYSIIRSKFKAC